MTASFMIKVLKMQNPNEDAHAVLFQMHLHAVLWSIHGSTSRV